MTTPTNIPATPQPYVVMTAEQWNAFRWRIAIEVLSVFSGENATQVKQAVSILRATELTITTEWR